MMNVNMTGRFSHGTPQNHAIWFSQNEKGKRKRKRKRSNEMEREQRLKWKETNKMESNEGSKREWIRDEKEKRKFQKKKKIEKKRKIKKKREKKGKGEKIKREKRKKRRKGTPSRGVKPESLRRRRRKRRRRRRFDSTKKKKKNPPSASFFHLPSAAFCPLLSFCLSTIRPIELIELVNSSELCSPCIAPFSLVCVLAFLFLFFQFFQRSF